MIPTFTSLRYRRVAGGFEPMTREEYGDKSTRQMAQEILADASNDTKDCGRGRVYLRDVADRHGQTVYGSIPWLLLLATQALGVEAEGLEG